MITNYEEQYLKALYVTEKFHANWEEKKFLTKVYGGFSSKVSLFSLCKKVIQYKSSKKLCLAEKLLNTVPARQSFWNAQVLPDTHPLKRQHATRQGIGVAPGDSGLDACHILRHTTNTHKWLKNYYDSDNWKAKHDMKKLWHIAFNFPPQNFKELNSRNHGINW